MKPIYKTTINYIVPYFAIFLFVCYIVAETFFPLQWFNGYDGSKHFLLSNEFAHAFLHGNLYPRWLPNLYGGYGQPTFVFYQPGYYFLSLPFNLLIADKFLAFNLYNFFLFFMGGVGAYLLIERFTNKVFAVFASLIFLSTPYLYVNFYVRGDLSETCAMLLAPWPLFFLLKLKDFKEVKIAIYKKVILIGVSGLALAFQTTCHPATTLFYFPFYLVMACAFAYKDKKWDKSLLLDYCSTIILALLFSFPYYSTLLQMREFVNWKRLYIGWWSYTNHFVYLKQFFSFEWDMKGGSYFGPKDTMSFQLGLVHFILATVGCILNKKRMIGVLSYVSYLFFIFIMTPYSSFIWKLFTVMQNIQFPWRILSVVAVVQLICLTGIYDFTRRIKAIFQIPIYIVIFLLIIILHHQQFYLNQKNKVDIKSVMEDFQRNKLHKIFKFTAMNEFLPIWATKGFRKGKGDPVSYFEKGRKKGTIILSSRPVGFYESPDSNEYHIKYQMEIREPTSIIINQFYFPGWKVYVDGAEIRREDLEKNLLVDGRMALNFKDVGRYNIEAYYDGPPYWKLRTFLQLILIFMVFFTIWKVKSIARK